MTEVRNHNYCLILAGGVGSRLWPVSTESKPKQFLDLLGTGRTLLQMTYDRVSSFVPTDNIFISTNVQYLDLVYEQLPDVDDYHILEEPLRRGSLASVVWGMVFMMHIDAEAAVLVTPCDQMIVGEEVFKREMLEGLSYVSRHDNLVVVGVKPTRPETGYGYIQKGVATEDTRGVYRLKTFTEKPALAFARLFVDEGDFLWNTGLHLFKAKYFLQQIYDLLPEYQIAIPRLMADAESDDVKLAPDVFMMLPRLGLDGGVLERSSNVCVLESTFGWSDLGTWGSLHEDGQQDATGNVLVDSEADFYDCTDNTVRLPQGVRLVAKGLHDFVIVQEGDTLLICPRADVTRLAREHKLNQKRD